jgi:hypothetical protein
VLPDLSELDFKILMLGADSGLRGDVHRVHAVQVCARECWIGRTRTRAVRGLPRSATELRPEQGGAAGPARGAAVPAIRQLGGARLLAGEWPI